MHRKILTTIFTLLFITGCGSQTLTNYTDSTVGISLSYPQEWSNKFTYAAVKIDELSEEKNIPVWEGEPISAKEQAQGEEEMLKTLSKISAEDPIQLEIQRAIITIATDTPALLTTKFREDGTAERQLRFYKDGWQITISKTLSVIKTGTTPSEIFKNLSADTAKPEAQTVTDAFAAMIKTIKFS